MTLSKKISGDIIISTLFTASLKLRGLLFIPLFTLGLGVADYGAFVQAFGIAIIAANVAALGLDTGLVQLDADGTRTSQLVSTMFVLSGLTALTIAGFTAGGAELLSIYTLSTTEYTLVFVAAAAYIPFEVIFRISRGYYHAQRRVRLYSGIQAVDVWLLVAAVAITILVLDGTVIEAFVAVVLAKIAITAAITLPVVREVGISAPSVDIARESLAFSLPTMGGDLSKHALDKVDRVLIGFFLGASAVGVYSVAYSIAYIILLFVTPVNMSFYTEFTALWNEGDRRTIVEYTKTGIRYFSTIALPAIIGFALIGDAVIGLISTAEVADAGHLLLVLIALAMFLRGCAEVYQRLFYATGDSRTPLLAQLAMVALNAVLNVLLIPVLGVAGAALTTIASFGVGAVLLGWLFQDTLRVVPNWGRLSRILVATGLMGITMAFVPLHWILILALAPPVYAVYLFATGGLRRREVSSLIKIVTAS